MSQEGSIFVPPPPKVGTNLRHPLPQLLKDSYMPRCYAGLSPSCACTGFLRLVDFSPIGAAPQVLPFRVRQQFSQSRCVSPLLTMSNRVYLLFLQCGLKPLSTLRYHLKSHHLCLRRRRFSIHIYAKNSDVAKYAIGPLFLRLKVYSPHCTLKVLNTFPFGSRPPLIQMSAPASEGNFVRNIISILLHRVILRVRLYEVIWKSSIFRCAPIMRRTTQGCTMRSLS